MKRVSHIIAIIMLCVMPVTAMAQFTPINQVRELGSQQDQKELDKVLGKISTAAAKYRRQIETVITDVLAKKLGVSAGQRKIDTILSNLKKDLQSPINDYAKKSPPPANLRAAFNAAQETLDDVRTRSEEGLDQGQELRKAEPGAVTGKYLEYQELIKGITAKTLQKVDQRLAERGSKNVVSKQVEQMVTDTLKQVDLSTDSFKVKNPSVLDSSLNRIKKTVVDSFGEAMAERYKVIADRSNDTDQDLGLGDLADKQKKEAEQNAKVQRTLTELQGLVDRYSNSANQILTQVQGAVRNVPTASQESGVNPALELKYRASEKTSKLRDQVFLRIDQLVKTSTADKTLSADSLDTIKRAAQSAKDSINYNLREYKAFFMAGDPSKKKYNKEKEEAQEEAEGCGSFFCDLGRIVGAAGSAIIGKETGINVNPQVISGGLFGIDEDHYVPGKYTGVAGGAISSVNGRYVANGAYGNQAVPYGSSCVGALPDAGKKFAFIEKAYAETGLPAGVTSNPVPSSSNSSSSGISGWWNNNRSTILGAVTGSVLGNLSQRAVNNGANPYMLPTQGCASPYASPYINGVLSPGAAQIIGINGQAVPSLGSNYATQFDLALQIIAQQNPQLAQSLAPLRARLADGQYNYNDINPINSGLLATGQFQSPYSNNPSLQNPAVWLSTVLCSGSNMINYPQLQSICRNLFTNSQGTVFNPNITTGGGIFGGGNTNNADLNAKFLASAQGMVNLQSQYQYGLGGIPGTANCAARLELSTRVENAAKNILNFATSIGVSGTYLTTMNTAYTSIQQTIASTRQSCSTAPDIRLLNET